MGENAAYQIPSQFVSRLSPLTLPWATIRLAGRFALPLALWFTVGDALRYVIFLGGYHFGLRHAPVPIIATSLIVMVNLAVTVAMLHSVKDGLRAIRHRELDESLAPWAAGEQETMLDAVTRALLPFMIFYLAWGWYADDAKDFEQAAAGRGSASGGITGQIEGMKLISALDKRVWLAIGLTAGFIALKFVMERLVEPKLPRVGSVAIAFCEVNWTLFGLFTVNKGYNAFWDWFDSRLVWTWVGNHTGPVPGWIGDLWPLFKDAVLGGLVWLVIAGVVLGVDSAEESALGEGRLGRRIRAASGIDNPRRPREFATRELRDKWLPAFYGFRLVFRSGMLPFGLFCALLAGLQDLQLLAKRGLYVLLGPHEVAYWNPRFHLIDYGVDMLYWALRACLLAAAFNLVVERVNARTAKPAAAYRPAVAPGPALPPIPQS